MDANLKAQRDPTSLSDKERALLTNWFYMFLSFMENNYYQRQKGVLDEEQSGALDSMPLVTDNDVHRKIWAQMNQRDLFSDGFVQHVNELIRSKGA